MKHLIEARNEMNKEVAGRIHVNGCQLTIEVQDGPIKEVGVNGIQVTDILLYLSEVYISLNNAFPCKENIATISSIKDALRFQAERTRDRERRGVEGFNKD